MVAEGPAVKRFERLQFETIAYDVEILHRALLVASEREGSNIPPNVLELIEIEVEPPSVKTRDRLQDVQADMILAGDNAQGIKVISKKTLASRQDADYDKERDQIRLEENEEQDHQAALAKKAAAAGITHPLQQPPDPNAPPKPVPSRTSGGEGGNS
jgi:hypothetical protein